MNNIKIFLSAFYETNKREFWLLVLFNILLGIIINAYPLNGMAQAIIIILMALKNISFLRSASVMPSISSDFDRYSWKYFQGLPLNKEELILCLIISNLFVMFPGLVWVMSFFIQLSGMFVDAKEVRFDVVLAIKVFLCLVPILVMVSTMSLSNLITFPRKQYSKNDPRHVFFYKVKTAVVGVTVMLYAITAYIYLSEFTQIDLVPYIGKALKFIFRQSTWWLVPALALMATLTYFGTLKVWQNEKKSYVKIDWQHKRDFSIIAVCIALVWVPVKVLDLFTPDEYLQGKIVNAVYKEDFRKVEALIKAGEDINEVNKFGMTPLLVAAIHGHEFMYYFLEQRGAKAEGVAKIKGDKILSGLNVYLAAIRSGNMNLAKHFLKPGSNPNEMNKENKWHAIHYAASYCKPKLLDLLIEKKADLNVVNADGQTALHLAAKDSCFASVVLLLDAGADPGIVDNKKKLAMDYATKSGYKSRDLDFYMQKRARLPAGK